MGYNSNAAVAQDQLAKEIGVEKKTFNMHLRRLQLIGLERLLYLPRMTLEDAKRAGRELDKELAAQLG